MFNNKGTHHMGMAAVIYKKGADNFGWEEIKVGSSEQGHMHLRSMAVGVNLADSYHRAGIPHPMIVGDPPIIVGFEEVAEIEELGPSVTGFSVEAGLVPVELLEFRGSWG
jgi:NADPH:quinone reductase-like Zn-dependent oxidoreductase